MPGLGPKAGEGVNAKKGTGHLSSRKCLISLDLGFDSSRGGVWAGTGR